MCVRFIVAEEECITSDKLDLGHSRSLIAQATLHFNHSLNKFCYIFLCYKRLKVWYSYFEL